MDSKKLEITCKDVYEKITKFPTIKNGEIYTAICPFHNDVSDSMKIDMEKDKYFCYKCESSGDAVDFIKQYAEVSTAEALYLLVKMFGNTEVI